MTSINSTSDVSASSTEVGLDGAAPLQSAASAPLAQERQVLRARVDVLHRIGALPTAPTLGSPTSVASWSNWSNG